MFSWPGFTLCVREQARAAARHPMRGCLVRNASQKPGHRTRIRFGATWVTALDYKGRTVLDEPAIQLLSLVVSTLRKSKLEDELHTDIEHVRDVLAALTLSGYAVIPQGAITTLKKILLETDI